VGIEFENLIRLQQIDDELRELSSFLENLPAQEKDIDKKIKTATRQVDKAREKLSLNQKRRRELEGETQDLREKIKKYKHQLNEVKTNLEYRSLLKEIEETQQRIDRLEEDIIAKLLEADEIEEEIKQVSAEVNQVKEKAEKEKQELRQQKQIAEEKRNQLLEEKNQLTPQIPPEQLALYHKIAAKRQGIALSPVHDEFCSLCHMRIRPQVINELKAGQTIILCENCGRILYWEEATEEEADSAKQAVKS
jgi:hypothetical protein